MAASARTLQVEIEALPHLHCAPLRLSSNPDPDRAPSHENQMILDRWDLPPGSGRVSEDARGHGSVGKESAALGDGDGDCGEDRAL